MPTPSAPRNPAVNPKNTAPNTPSSDPREEALRDLFWLRDSGLVPPADAVKQSAWIQGVSVKSVARTLQPSLHALRSLWEQGLQGCSPQEAIILQEHLRLLTDPQLEKLVVILPILEKRTLVLALLRSELTPPNEAMFDIVLDHIVSVPTKSKLRESGPRILAMISVWSALPPYAQTPDQKQALFRSFQDSNDTRLDAVHFILHASLYQDDISKSILGLWKLHSKAILLGEIEAIKLRQRIWDYRVSQGEVSDDPTSRADLREKAMSYGLRIWRQRIDSSDLFRDSDQSTKEISDYWRKCESASSKTEREFQELRLDAQLCAWKVLKTLGNGVRYNVLALSGTLVCTQERERFHAVRAICKLFGSDMIPYERAVGGLTELINASSGEDVKTFVSRQRAHSWVFRHATELTGQVEQISWLNRAELDYVAGVLNDGLFRTFEEKKGALTPLFRDLPTVQNQIAQYKLRRQLWQHFNAFGCDSRENSVVRVKICAMPASKLALAVKLSDLEPYSLSAHAFVAGIDQILSMPESPEYLSAFDGKMNRVSRIWAHRRGSKSSVSCDDCTIDSVLNLTDEELKQSVERLEPLDHTDRHEYILDHSGKCTLKYQNGTWQVAWIVSFPSHKWLLPRTETRTLVFEATIPPSKQLVVDLQNLTSQADYEQHPLSSSFSEALQRRFHLTQLPSMILSDARLDLYLPNQAVVEGVTILGSSKVSIYGSDIHLRGMKLYGRDATLLIKALNPSITKLQAADASLHLDITGEASNLDCTLKNCKVTGSLGNATISSRTSMTECDAVHCDFTSAVFATGMGQHDIGHRFQHTRVAINARAGSLASHASVSDR